MARKNKAFTVPSDASKAVKTEMKRLIKEIDVLEKRRTAIEKALKDGDGDQQVLQENLDKLWGTFKQPSEILQLKKDLANIRMCHELRNCSRVVWKEGSLIAAQNPPAYVLDITTSRIYFNFGTFEDPFVVGRAGISDVDVEATVEAFERNGRVTVNIDHSRVR